VRRSKSAQLGGATQFYSTIPWMVHRLLAVAELPLGNWIEPGFGTGGIMRAVHSFWGHGEAIQWDGVELDDRIYEAGTRRIAASGMTATLRQGDFLSMDPPKRLFDCARFPTRRPNSMPAATSSSRGRTR